jgi:eukaryotic-like serine/threonine-protein kinase
MPVTDAGQEILDGKWSIEGKLGQGGMGTVFLATDLQLDRKVAIKTLAAALCQDEGVVSRFEREAKMMAKLDHPNLVPIYAVGRKGQVPFIVMKYLEGTNLSEHLRQRGKLPLPELLHIAQQVCAGLGFVHTRGFTHRDIKPANIIIAPDGHVTILDLGVAHDPKSQLTKSGLLIGTPRYMSPEQVLGKKVDQRSDLYALGTVLFEMATGAPVFDGESDFSVMRSHTDVEPPDPSANGDVPPAVAAVIKRALAKTPGERFQSAAELYQALDAATRPGSPDPVLDKTYISQRTPRPEDVPTDPAPPPRRPGELDRTVMMPDAPAAIVTQVMPRERADSTLQVVRAAMRPRSKAPLLFGGLAAVTVTFAAAYVAYTPPPVPQPEPVAEVVAPAAPPAVIEKPPDPPLPEEIPAPVVVTQQPAVKAPAIKRGDGELVITTTFNGQLSWAWLDVDGSRVGSTPKKLKLAPGTHVIRLERPGYKPISRQVTVAAGQSGKLPLELEQP